MCLQHGYSLFSEAIKVIMKFAATLETRIPKREKEQKVVLKSAIPSRALSCTLPRSARQHSDLNMEKSGENGAEYNDRQDNSASYTFILKIHFVIIRTILNVTFSWNSNFIYERFYARTISVA